MSVEDDPELVKAEAALFEADLDLAHQAFEIAIAPRFPEYTELVFKGARPNEPHFIYRGGDSFLVIDTAVTDRQHENEKVPQRELPDGRMAERGTREYLLAGLESSKRTEMVDPSFASEISAALSANRVRYILITVTITESAAERELASVKLAEFEISSMNSM